MTTSWTAVATEEGIRITIGEMVLDESLQDALEAVAVIKEACRQKIESQRKAAREKAEAQKAEREAR